ncbi:MAG: hypothetical protein R3Y28_02110 [Candidatus Gastranaerophilales bacterium]
MKEKCLIAIIIVLVATMIIQNTTQNSYERYKVVDNDSLTILIDQKTGQTWRNSICQEGSQVPGCWDKMYYVNPEPMLQPIGEAKLTKKIRKIIEKQEKAKQKQQQKLEKEQKQMEVLQQTSK